MKLAGAAIERFLKSPDKNVRAVLVYGPDEGLVRERARALALSVVEDLNDPFRVASFAHEAPLIEDATRLADEAASLSLMGGRRLVRVREASDKLAKAVALLLDRDSDSFSVLEAGDLGPRSALRKLFEASPHGAAMPCYVEDERQLARTLSDALAERNVRIDGDALQALASSLVGDRMIARQEVEKLATYLGPGTTATLEDVEAVVGDSAGLAIDDAAQAAASGDVPGLDRCLTRLFAEATSAIGLLRVAQTYVRRLHATRARIDAGDSVDAACAKLQPPLFFKARDNFMRQVERWTLPRLETAMNGLVAAEAACKRTGAEETVLASRAMFAVAQLAARR
ncbi:MAG: polymerase subunit delta [Rhodospirillales bacterium]|nr:polymerase subunit delta [Rhodospirillales bacterium]